MQAAAMNNTRYQARDKGRGLLSAALASGQGQAGLALNAYSGALNAGNAAGQNAMAPGNNYMAGLGQAAGTAAQGYGLGLQGRQLQMQGLSHIMSTQGSIYNNYESPWAAGIGLGGNMLATYAGLQSDRRMKENIVEVGEYENGLPMYEFNYIGIPDKRYRGVMADDVARFDPGAVHEVAGIAYVDYGRLGIEMEAVR